MSRRNTKPKAQPHGQVSARTISDRLVEMNVHYDTILAPARRYAREIAWSNRLTARKDKLNAKA